MRRPLAVTTSMTLLVGFVVAACGPVSPPASVPASASPAGAAPTATAALPDPTRRPGEPPPAALAAEGGDPVIGQLGSFMWGGAGSDSPWLPGATIHVGTGERLTMALADGVTTTAWSARRTRADHIASPEPLPMAEAAGGPVSFLVPPPGLWSVEVTVRFSGDQGGSASYYWLVTVT